MGANVGKPQYTSIADSGGGVRLSTSAVPARPVAQPKSGEGVRLHTSWEVSTRASSNACSYVFKISLGNKTACAKVNVVLWNVVVNTDQ